MALTDLTIDCSRELDSRSGGIQNVGRLWKCVR